MRFDDEYLEDRTDGDDETELPVRAWIRDFLGYVHDLILAEGDLRFAFNDTPLAPSPSYQRLRC